MPTHISHSNANGKSKDEITTRSECKSIAAAGESVPKYQLYFAHRSPRVTKKRRPCLATARTNSRLTNALSTPVHHAAKSRFKCECAAY